MLIGYWSSKWEPDWPDPHDFVDEGWDARERALVARYLESGFVPWVQAGVSQCRFCGAANGSTELTDGVYLWPAGLSHYVSEHGVRLPQQVVDHIRTRVVTFDDVVDRDWWSSARPDW